MFDPWRTRTVLGVIAGAVAIYLLLFIPSCQGWGYGGPANPPSFWSFTSIDTYHGASVRAGSRTGPGIAGGGK